MNKHEARITMFSVFYPIFDRNFARVKTFKKNIELFFGRTFHAKRRTEDFIQKGGHMSSQRWTYGNPRLGAKISGSY